jgi:hypothetical protein
MECCQEWVKPCREQTVQGEEPPFCRHVPRRRAVLPQEVFQRGPRTDSCQLDLIDSERGCFEGNGGNEEKSNPWVQSEIQILQLSPAISDMLSWMILTEYPMKIQPSTLGYTH